MARLKLNFAIWSLLAVLTLAGVAGVWLMNARAARPVHTDLYGVAIQGYDTVAYFTEGKATRGDSRYQLTWRDAKWRFASAAHRDLFQADPERYLPQYGGFCAGYLAADGIADVDPEAWVIVDGKLYLNWSKQGRDEFANEDTEEKIRRAGAGWAERQGLSS